MESRNWVLAIAGAIMIVACSALAVGWKNVAEDALAAQRQCIATGERHVAKLPRIAIGADIVFEGETLISTDDVLRDSPAFKVDALFEKMDRLRKPCDSNKVCLDNLVSLTFENPDIRVVKTVVNSAWAAGFDVLLRPQHETRSW